MKTLRSLTFAMIIAVISFSSCKKMHIHAYSCNCYTCEDYFNEYGNCDGVNGTWNNGTFMNNQNPGGFMNNQNTGPCPIVCVGDGAWAYLVSEPMSQNAINLESVDGQSFIAITNGNGPLFLKIKRLWNDSTIALEDKIVDITATGSNQAPLFLATGCTDPTN
jgi:hypothetical protein